MPRILALLVAGSLLGACTVGGSNEDATTSSTIPPAATVLDVAAARWPSCLNPLLCDGDPARQLVYQHVLPRLLEIDHDGRYVPSPVLTGPPDTVVEANGQQRITYRLSADARWHDGRPITSSDVKGTWMARMDTPGAATSLDASVVAVDDRDPLVAVVTLSSAQANWRELFGGYRGWLLEADAFGDDTNLTGQFLRDLPFGAGPFELVSFDDARIVLAARAEHWDPEEQAGVDRVQIEHVDAGDPVPSGVDVVMSDVGAEAAGDLAVRRSPSTQVVGLFFDQRTPALADPAVRHAIDLGVDRRTLLDVAVPTGVDPPELVRCLGWLPADPACDDDLPETAEDPGAADALLAQVGWPRDESGQRGGPFGPLTLSITFDPSIDRAAAIADALRFRIEALGAQVVDERPLAANTWAAGDRQDSTGIGVFAVELGTPARVSRLYACPGGAANPMAWCPPELGDLLGELGTTVDLEDRRAVAVQISDLAAGAFVWLPLFQRTESWLVAADRVSVPEHQPLDGGAIGALHGFARTDQ